MTELLEPSHHKTLEKGATPPSSFFIAYFFVQSLLLVSIGILRAFAGVFVAPEVQLKTFWCGALSSKLNTGTLGVYQDGRPWSQVRVTPGSYPPVWHVLRGLCSPDESREHKLHDMSDRRLQNVSDRRVLNIPS